MTISLATHIKLSPGAQIVAFDSSTRARMYRVELADGRHFQINERLYDLLECLHLPTSLTQLAQAFEARTGETVDDDELRQLSTHLEEQGVILRSGQTPVQRPGTDAHANSLLALHFRRDLLSADTIAPFARGLRVLFAPALALPSVAMIVGVHAYVYAQTGFPPNLQMEGISWPVLYAVMLASFLLHELGHLAACQRWQCPHGPLGFGLYFFNPVFYVDVTAAWRLNRRQRTIVDIGGVYIQLVFVSALWFLYYFLHDETYLLALLLTDLMVLSNFEPFMKLDGYWLLSDATGVPNLHARTMELISYGWARLRRLLRTGAALPARPSLSQWPPLVRIVLLLYVVLSAAIWPLVTLALIPMLFDLVVGFPGLVLGALEQLGAAIRSGDVAGGAAQLQALFLPTMMLLNLAFLLKRLAGRMRRPQRTY